MDEQRWLAERFEERRPRLRAVAYRMLGSLSEADDAVQDAWLRVSRSDTAEVENLDAWLTTIIARISLNMLRPRRTRREEPLGPHVPDPVIDAVNRTNPEHEPLLAGFARHLRRPVRGDCAHRRPFTGSCSTAREPSPPARTRERSGARR
jgi:DNA-directed RNA polymerase specialized sigma24 family protein